MTSRPQQAPASVVPVPLPLIGVVRYWTAGGSAVVGATIALAAFAGVWVATAAVLLAVMLLAWGWPSLVDLPSPRGTTSILAFGGAGAAVSVALSSNEPRLEWLALALAASVIAEFTHQLARRDGRPRLVESVSGTVAGVVLLASLSAVLALPATRGTATAVLTWAAAVVAALLTQVLRLPGRITVPVGIAIGGLLGGLLGGVFAAGTLPAGLVVGTLSAGVAVVVHRLLSSLPAAGRAPGWLALSVAPLAASAMVAYVVLRLMLG